MKCSKCGADDWYQRGKYRRCRPCHLETSSRSYHALKISSTKERKRSHPRRTVSQDMKRLSPAILEKRLMTACGKGHTLDGENVRLETDSKGRTHRRCRKCENLRNRKKYGIGNDSKMADLLGDPWDRL